MTKSSKVQQNRLAMLEAEFEPLLIACLQKCAQGRYGLFGQNDHVDPDGRYYGSPEVTRVKEMAHEIQSLHSISGSRNEICEEYLQLYSLKGSNIPGEPKLASAFLSQIGQI
jgi:hypothetical protein